MGEILSSITRNAMTYLIVVIISFLSLLGILISLTYITHIQGQENSTFLIDSFKTTRIKAPVIDLIRNPMFTSINKTSTLPSYWISEGGNCRKSFECSINSREGWHDKLSLEVSTDNTTSQNWSWIRSNEIWVKSGQIYEIQGHIKLNNSTAQSHILLEGLNQSSAQWYQIIQCPPGTNGPLEWKEFVCKLIIPPNTNTIALVLNAGWSSQRDQNATTLFDAVHLYKTN